MLPVVDYALALSMGVGLGWTVKKASKSLLRKGGFLKFLGVQPAYMSTLFGSKFFIFSAVFFDISISVKLFVQTILPCPNSVRLN